MIYIALLSRFLLALIFLFSSISKLANRDATTNAVLNLGVPIRWAKLVSKGLPIVELALVPLLLYFPTSFLGAIFALLLLILFTVFISINLRKGNNVECHCFGEFSSQPISWLTVARNIVFMLLTLVVIGTFNLSSPILFSSIFDNFRNIEIYLIATTILFIVIFFIQGWFIVHLTQQQGRLLLRLEELESFADAAKQRRIGRQHSTYTSNKISIGDKVPSFLSSTLSKRDFSLAKYLKTNNKLVLFFVDPNCGPCRALFPEIAYWQKKYGDFASFILISKGTQNENLTIAKNLNASEYLVQENSELNTLFGIHSTPSAFVISSDGYMETNIARGAIQIKELIDKSVVQLDINQQKMPKQDFT